MARDTKYSVAGPVPRRKAKYWLLAIVLLIILIFAAVAVTLLVLLRSRTHNDILGPHPSKLVVYTDCGPVQGSCDTLVEGHQALVFKGIPYAKPPVGNLRWKPTEPLWNSSEGGQCWNGTLNATQFGPLCAQPTQSNRSHLVGTEDCLTLNIWTPLQKSDALLPVMLWIHGGGLLGGGSFFPGYAPNAQFVNALGVVAVSVNYRLNAFGFLTLDVLSDDSPTNSSGNYGIMDMIEALRWVKRNIKAFGGDPDLVTVFGHSGGGKAVYALIASPLASGLYHRAIVMSGPAVYLNSYDKVAKDNAIFIEKANCSKASNRETLACLYNLTAAQILAATPYYIFPFWGMQFAMDLPRKDQMMPTFAVIDPVVVPVSPLDLATSKAKIKPVPIMVTTTLHETEKSKTRALSNLKYHNFTKHVNLRLGTFWDSLTNESLDLYMPNGSLSSYGLIYTEMASDIRVTCPNNFAVERLAAVNGSMVYRLAVESRPSKRVFYNREEYLYSFHGWDTFALFNFQVPNSVRPGNLYEPTPRDLKFRDDLQGEFAHFVKFGYPLNKDWLKYPNNVAVYQNAGMVTKEAPYRQKYCSFWNPKTFFKYGWVL